MIRKTLATVGIAAALFAGTAMPASADTWAQHPVQHHLTTTWRTPTPPSPFVQARVGLIQPQPPSATVRARMTCTIRLYRTGYFSLQSANRVCAYLTGQRVIR